MSGKSLGFLELFPGCAGLAGMCGGLDKATVQGAVVKEDEYTMSVSATFACIPAPAELEADVYKRQVYDRVEREEAVKIDSFHVEIIHLAGLRRLSFTSCRRMW